MMIEAYMLIIIIRVVLAAIFVLYLPGYVISVFLFPSKKLDVLERIFFSLVISIAVSSIVCVISLLAFGQLRMEYFLYIAAALVVIFTLGTYKRSGQRISINREGLASFKLVSLQKRNLLIVLLFGVILFILIALAPATSIIQTNPSGLTEFYVVPESLNNVLAGNTQENNMLTVPLGIVNRQNQAARYRLKVLDNDQAIFEAPAALIDSGDAWQGKISIPITDAGRPRRIDIYLYSNLSDAPVAQLRLWQ